MVQTIRNFEVGTQFSFLYENEKLKLDLAISG